jgi:hypothetical protein
VLLGYSASSLRPAGPPTSESEDAGRSPVDARTWPWTLAGRLPFPVCSPPAPVKWVVSLALQVLAAAACFNDTLPRPPAPAIHDPGRGAAEFGELYLSNYTCHHTLVVCPP